MSPVGRDKREAGLEQLAGDVLGADRPDPEELLRFARDPDSFSTEERARIEAQLRDSALLRDQLSLLQQTDVASLVRRSHEEPVGSFRFNPLRMLVPVLGVAAALLLVWLYPIGLNPDSSGDGEGTRQARVEPEDVDPEPLDPVPVPDIAPEIAEAPDPGSAPPPTITEPPDPIPDPVLAETTAPKTEPWEVDYLAMADVAYRAPIGFDPIPGVEPWVRAAGTELKLSALAPDHLGLTSAATPILYWSISAPPPAGSELLIVISDREGAEPLLERALPVPTRAGLQRIALADLGFQLEEARPYRWSVILVSDPANPAGSLQTGGWIQRVEARDSLSPTDLGIRARDAASDGRWYDALEAIARAEAQESAPQSRAALRSLLASQGLEDLVP